MSYIDISAKDRQAIDQKELKEYEQRRLRGTGYDMMRVRDRSYGTVPAAFPEYRPLHVEWHVDVEKREKGSLYRPLPKGTFALRIGDQETIVNAEDLRRLLRWA